MDFCTPVKWPAELMLADGCPYVIKHNPFSSFANIVNNEQRWSNNAGSWSGVTRAGVQSRFVHRPVYCHDRSLYLAAGPNDGHPDDS